MNQFFLKILWLKKMSSQERKIFNEIGDKSRKPKTIDQRKRVENFR